MTYLFSKLEQVRFVSPWHREQLLHYTSTIPERLHSVHQSEGDPALCGPQTADRNIDTTQLVFKVPSLTLLALHKVVIFLRE
jgi:hypothetical protein